ncbi:DUF2975 domain-containing protein [Alkaliphilus transvaalensis]|uniref:DUF2975 domain-containing protein n=1 Tax=Alkaliphilus transvaalensis TaxID=114628 RepID=UPI0004787099|nr:DUF2975 domain-containing protein [Alkaliphilus transvaalensis]
MRSTESTESTESTKYLNVFLNLLMLIGIIGLFLFIPMIYSMIRTKELEGVGSLLYVLSGFISSIGSLAIIVMLKRVVRTILFERNPFVEGNIMRFKRMAYIFFAFPLVSTIYQLTLIATGRRALEATGSLGASLVSVFISNIFIGCVVLVLANVFRFAMEIKKDNDLTV